MPPCPCCGESRQDHMWRLLGPVVRCDTCGRRYKDEPMPSQDQRIAELESQLEALRGWIQECDDGVSNLGTRVAKLEDAAQEWRDRQHGINGDIYRQMRGWLDELTLKRINGDNALDQRIQARAIELEHRIDNYQSRLNRLNRQARRVREQFPSVGEPTPAQALTAIGLEEAPQSTGKPTTILITRKGLDELKTTAREGDNE